MEGDGRGTVGDFVREGDHVAETRGAVADDACPDCHYARGFDENATAAIRGRTTDQIRVHHVEHATRANSQRRARPVATAAVTADAGAISGACDKHAVAQDQFRWEEQ
eukprot:5026588-Pleurochrysis_carterae.AAC.1